VLTLSDKEGVAWEVE